MAPKIDWKPVLGFLKEEFETVTNSVKEKGYNHFQRPLALGLVMVALAWLSVNYVLDPIRRMKRVENQIAAAKASAQYADSYSLNRSRLSAFYAVLPALKDRDQWLYGAFIDSLKAENIVSETLQPPTEEEVPPGLIFQKETLTATVRFPELMSWLSRIERLKPAVQVSSLSLNKKANTLGDDTVVCEITTIIPKARY